MVSRIHRYPRIHFDKPNDEIGKILFLGTCGLSPIVVGLRNHGVAGDHVLWESLGSSPLPDIDVAGYDATVVHLTLLHIFAEAAYKLEPDTSFGNGIYLPRAVANGRLEEYFEACADFTRGRVDAIMPLLKAKPVFFMSFIEPKHNYVGNLMPRFNLSNPAHFVRKLNEVLEEAIAAHASTYYFDMNELASLVGRARFQDDYIGPLGHGSIIGDDDSDQRRMQRSTPPTEMWDSFDVQVEFEQVVVRRFLDDLAIIRQSLQIKAIIVDVDDTLWRGIAAEEPDKPSWEFMEGWPLGMAEALLFYKIRGGMLAICSKNDEELLLSLWEKNFHGRLRVEDFASVRINFERKSDNVRSILSELNILPQNVLFIDDNPREIDEVRSVFPKMHFLSADHHDWRRKILMFPEMQVASISSDAALRTASVQANTLREKAREGLSYEDWLASLQLAQEVVRVTDSNHPRFERAFELLNKTNQFNTTGKRWERAEVKALLERGGYLACSMLRDKLADNGMISVLVVEGGEIVQAVLSCRAFKYEAEIAAGHLVCADILSNHPVVRAKIVDTGLNGTCHSYFRRMGFSEFSGEWIADRPPEWPTHIRTPDESSPRLAG